MGSHSWMPHSRTGHEQSHRICSGRRTPYSLLSALHPRDKVHCQCVEVVPDARKHRVLDEDMRHAVRHAVRTIDLQDDQKTLMIGADRAGRLLEVVVVGLDTDRSRIIHAMRLRRSFYRFLEGR